MTLPNLVLESTCRKLYFGWLARSGVIWQSGNAKRRRKAGVAWFNMGELLFRRSRWRWPTSATLVSSRHNTRFGFFFS